MRCVGFKYNRLNQQLVIMETVRLKKQRCNYTTKTRKYREENWYIAYVDDGTHDMIKKGLIDGTTLLSRMKRIILHSGGSDIR